MTGFDPIPPGHGEPEYSPSLYGRGSRTYSDEEWDAVAATLTVPVPPTPEEDIAF